MRDNMTSEEWDELEQMISADRRNGKPDESFVSFCVLSLPHDKLIAIRESLIALGVKWYELTLLDRWITYREKFKL